MGTSQNWILNYVKYPDNYKEEILGKKKKRRSSETLHFNSSLPTLEPDKKKCIIRNK